MSITVHDLFETPDLYLWAFENDQAIFTRMDREAYHQSLFLDDRIETADQQRIAVPADAIAEWRDGQNMAIAPKGWIFHVANCGSTLLARALDRLRGDLVLREPLALRQLGVDHASTPPSSRDAWSMRLRLVATQLGKRYRVDTPVIVKANVPVNFILPDLMALDPAAPAILLYYPLRDYILAVARSDQHRNWVTRVTNELRPALAQSVGDIAALDPVERAAALWLGQIRAFAAALERFPNAFSLDASTLFSRPRETIDAASRLFGLPLSDFDLDAILGSALFTTYSKNPGVAFSEDDRRARADELARSMAGDLTRAAAWVADKLSTHPLPDHLVKPLIGESRPLL